MMIVFQDVPQQAAVVQDMQVFPDEVVIFQETMETVVLLQEVPQQAVVVQQALKLVEVLVVEL